MPKVREYGYEYDAVIDKALAKKTEGKCVEHIAGGAILLRSGRDALKAVAREFSRGTVLLPALACDSMILPFEQYGHDIVFYNLREDYSIDYDKLKPLLDNDNETTILLYMDYFGKRSFCDGQLSQIRGQYPHTVFVEDCTHNLLYSSERSFLPHYTVASLRKWINIPDGGLLWSHTELAQSQYTNGLEFTITRRNAQEMRYRFLKSGDETLKTKYRRIFSTVTDKIDEEILPGRMSEYAYELAMREDWNALRECRKENAAELIELLSRSKEIEFIQKDLDASNLYVPILVKNRDEVQRILSRMGIFTTLIWPLRDIQKNECAVAKYTEEHMLGIPCDQRYAVEDMWYIGKEIVRVIDQI